MAAPSERPSRWDPSGPSVEQSAPLTINKWAAEEGGVRLLIILPFTAVTGLFLYVGEAFDEPCWLDISLYDAGDAANPERRQQLYFGQLTAEAPAGERPADPLADSSPTGYGHGVLQHVQILHRRERVLIAQLFVPEGADPPTTGWVDAYVTLSTFAMLSGSSEWGVG